MHSISIKNLLDKLLNLVYLLIGVLRGSFCVSLRCSTAYMHQARLRQAVNFFEVISQLRQQHTPVRRLLRNLHNLMEYSMATAPMAQHAWRPVMLI